MTIITKQLKKVKKYYQEFARRYDESVEILKR
jgi:hypothetical protein